MVWGTSLMRTSMSITRALKEGRYVYDGLFIFWFFIFFSGWDLGAAVGIFGIFPYIIPFLALFPCFVILFMKV